MDHTVKQLIAVFLVAAAATVSRAAPSKEIYKTHTTTIELLAAPPDERVGAGKATWRHIHIVHRPHSGDEQEATVRIREWEFISADQINLDEDSEDELVVVSRGDGTGPYYCMQIIDFTKDGFIATSSSSLGLPKVNDKVIILGFGEYEGAGTVPAYSEFYYRTGAVIPLKTEVSQETVQEISTRDRLEWR